MRALPRKKISVLFNEPKLLKSSTSSAYGCSCHISVLFNEPKLLKCSEYSLNRSTFTDFSALQRAEIAEIDEQRRGSDVRSISVLFNEPKLLKSNATSRFCRANDVISVLFNEPKLLKCLRRVLPEEQFSDFSALQRAEIAEMSRGPQTAREIVVAAFQCSSTSRNC